MFVRTLREVINHISDYLSLLTRKNLEKLTTSTCRGIPFSRTLSNFGNFTVKSHKAFGLSSQCPLSWLVKFILFEQLKHSQSAKQSQQRYTCEDETSSDGTSFMRFSTKISRFFFARSETANSSRFLIGSCCKSKLKTRTESHLHCVNINLNSDFA